MAEKPIENRNNAGILIPILLVGIILAFFVPLPAFLLDTLQAFNITIALTILLITMYTKDALEFSAFPTILLVTTLLRLALNVSSSKMILSQGLGFEGHVIRAFGDFVVGGNYVIGITMYIILFIVQFLVITKGSERVAEVAARFTLDAMPGKQMSIDADYNAGLITEDEARFRRKKIQREADFYGAMDGATKFVKGDAIAGIIITILNIIMGLIIGVFQRQEPLAEAAQTYIILTVGDGLVTMIPALLISVATAMVVTRSASESDLGTELIKQFLQDPRILNIAAGAIVVIGLIPGMPKLPFFAIAAGLWYLARVTTTKVKEAVASEIAATEEKKEDENEKHENVKELLKIDQMELEIGYSLIPLVDAAQGGDLLERITMIRKQIAIELGFIVPPIRIRDNMQLNPNEYSIKIRGAEVSKGEVMIGNYLAMNPGGVDQEINGIPTIEPAFGLPAIWITSEQRERAELSGYTVVDPTSVVATHITEIIKKYAPEILTREIVKELIENIKVDYAVIVGEVFPGKLDLGEIQSVLQNLLHEGVSIRNLPLILEVLSDASKFSKKTDVLTEYVRIGLARQICNSAAGTDKKLKVITLNPVLESYMKENISDTDFGSFLNISPDISSKLISGIMTENNRAASYGYQAVLLVTPEIRKPVRRTIEREIKNLNVLSYNEVTSEIELESVGMVSVEI